MRRRYNYNNYICRAFRKIWVAVTVVTDRNSYLNFDANWPKETIPENFRLASLHTTVNIISHEIITRNLKRMSSPISNRTCSHCRRTLPSALFTRNQIASTFYKTCLNCRNEQKERRLHLRRQRLASPPRPIINAVHSNIRMLSAIITFGN